MARKSGRTSYRKKGSRSYRRRSGGYRRSGARSYSRGRAAPQTLRIELIQPGYAGGDPEQALINQALQQTKASRRSRF